MNTKEVNELLESIQKDIFEQLNARTDVYYQKGQGALFVNENYPLNPSNVIFALSDRDIRFALMMRG